MAGLLSSILFATYKQRLDDQERQREMSAHLAKTVANLAMFSGNTALLEQQKEFLTRTYGQEGFNQLLTGAQVFPAALNLAQRGDRGITTMEQGAGASQPAQPAAAPSLPGAEGPEMPAPAPTPTPAPAQPQDAFAAYATQLKANAPPPAIPRQSVTLNAEGGLSITQTTEKNPAHEQYWKDAFMAIHGNLVAQGMDRTHAYTTAQAMTGYAYPVDPMSLGMNDMEATRLFNANLYNIRSAPDSRAAFNRAFPQLKPGSREAENLYNLLTAQKASQLSGNYLPSELRGEVYGTTGMTQQRQIETNYAETLNRLNLEYGDMLRRPVPADTVASVGMPLGSTMSDIISAHVTPLLKADVDKLRTINSSVDVLNRLDKLGEKVYTSEGGLSRLAQGAKNWAKGVRQNPDDVDVVIFSNLVEGLAAVFARSAAGESGVLTERDIPRAKVILPNVWQGGAVGRAAIDELRSMFLRKREEYLKPPTRESYSTPPAIPRRSGETKEDYLKRVKGISQ